MDIDCLSPDKLELAKIPPREIHHLTEQEVNTILAAPDHWCEKNELKCWRDKAILWTLYGSGLRVSELINVKIADLPQDGQQFSLVGKGRKMRSVFLTTDAREVIDHYV